ncbi:MAG: hypothetical protein WKF89_12330 [Chitinophagaceae bacterium]
MIKKSGLPVRYWVGFFCLKSAVGCYYGYWYSRPQQIASSDTWRFHAQAFEEYKLLLNRPASYFVNLLENPYNSWEGVLASRGYWNNLKDNLMVKIISLLNILSGGHYYVNVVIYSFITFWAFLFFYLSCRNLLNKTPGVLTTATILLTPSCLFWTSGIHRDGLVFLFLALSIWQSTKPGLRQGLIISLAIIILSITGIFLFRNYLAILLIPPLAAYFIVAQSKIRPYLVYTATAFVFISLFFLSPVISAKMNLPAALIARKMAFEKLEGTSRLPYMDLTANVKSFAVNFLKAIDHSLLRPYWWEAKNLTEKVASLEILFILLIIVTSSVFRKKLVEPDVIRFQWMIVFFCFCTLLVIGYTIPFAGAIVRYRAIFLMLMLSTLSLSVPDKIRKILI